MKILRVGEFADALCSASMLRPSAVNACRAERNVAIFAPAFPQMDPSDCEMHVNLLWKMLAPGSYLPWIDQAFGADCAIHTHFRKGLQALVTWTSLAGLAI
jgi:hypothetical protein